VPRWFSEGLSVFEERRARSGWGADLSAEFLAAYKGNHVRKVSELNEGFVQPRFPSELQFSYYAASLVCEMIYAEKGATGIVGMLDGYREGLGTPEIVQKVFGMSMDAFDRKFDEWLRARFAQPLKYVTEGDGPGNPNGEFVNSTIRGMQLLGEKKYDEAKVELEKAQAMFPDYSGPKGPAWGLALIYRQQGNVQAAIAQLTKITTQNETAWEANQLEAELRAQAGDNAGAARALDRLAWIYPYEQSTHEKLATLAAQMGDHARAVRSRRAIVALDPADKLEARYQLARALANAGDNAGARKEVLTILESAPNFEKAQALLLELRGKSP
jgi:tetratricopeptide (TPR) repeat protein